MRKKLLLLVMLFSSVYCMASGEDGGGRSASAKSIQPDSTVYAILGQTISDVLFKVQEIRKSK